MRTVTSSSPPLALTPAQRALLDHWLPMNPEGARGLLFESSYPPLDQARLEKLLREVRAMRERFAGTPSMLIAPVPLKGNGAPQRPFGDGDKLSRWEIAWLVVDGEPTHEGA